MNKQVITMIKKMKADKASDMSILSNIKVTTENAIVDNFKCQLSFPCGGKEGLYNARLAINGIWKEGLPVDADRFPAENLNDNIKTDTHILKIAPPIDCMVEALDYVSDDETRYFMNGIFLDWSDHSSVTIVATDGRRLYAKNQRDSINAESSLILPVYPEIVQALKDKAEIFVQANRKELDDFDKNGKHIGKKMVVCSYRVSFVTDSYTLVLRETIDGQFPNYYRVIPDYNSLDCIDIKIPSKQFLGTIKKVNEREDTRIELKDGQWNNEAGTVTEQGDAGYNIALDFQYLADAQKIGAVVLRCNKDANKAVTSSSDNRGLIVIMPMQRD